MWLAREFVRLFVRLLPFWGGGEGGGGGHLITFLCAELQYSELPILKLNPHTSPCHPNLVYTPYYSGTGYTGNTPEQGCISTESISERDEKGRERKRDRGERERETHRESLGNRKSMDVLLSR